MRGEVIEGVVESEQFSPAVALGPKGFNQRNFIKKCFKNRGTQKIIETDGRIGLD